ncbi:MAG: ABC transporter permease [Eubacterium sp.]|nr:ABC transporter permease [Eubacterium sp.]
MKRIIVNKRILIIAIVVAVEILLGIILLCVHSHAKGRKEVLYSQQAAARFSVDNEAWAQISIFYSKDMGLGSTDINNIRSEVQKKLYDDSLLERPKDSGVASDARTWYDAYSGHTFDDVRKDSTSVHVNVYTVGGDFFLIHNIPLLGGSYLDMNSTDVNQILIDEYVANVLFGSSNAAGMKLWIGDAVYTVTGVVACDDFKAADDAYGEYYSVYVPMEAYSKTRSIGAAKSNNSSEDSKGDDISSGGNSEGTVATCYEMVLPNPIKNYGLNTVAEAADIKFMTDEEKEAARSSLNFGDREIIDNTARFKVSSLYDRMKMQEYESLRTNAIVYPYWENEARFEEAHQIKLMRFSALIIGIMLLILLISAVSLFIHIRNICQDTINKMFRGRTHMV